MMNILEEVKKAIFKVQPGLDESKIVPAALLKEDLEIDSLAQVEMVLMLEDTLNITLPDEDLDNIFTVGDVIALIESKLRAKNA
jgi:acyl carrier protein